MKKSVIYEPKGQALEYSELATNVFRGCGHKCSYCYVPLVTKQKRSEFNASAVIRNGYLSKLKRDALIMREEGDKRQVMFSFTTDPYHPFDTSATRQSIEILKEQGVAFCTLTKGGARALRDIDLFDCERDSFATTLTSVNDETRKWESGAATSENRIKTLEAFHSKGVFTWVSLEPTLSAECSHQVVERTSDFVDLYKVGKANYLGDSIKVDWERYTLEMIDVLSKLGKKHYIKKDLQCYLPEGYHNPLRVEQHK